MNEIHTVDERGYFSTAPSTFISTDGEIFPGPTGQKIRLLHLSPPPIPLAVLARPQMSRQLPEPNFEST